jgi:hypothetical protein
VRWPGDLEPDADGEPDPVADAGTVEVPDGAADGRATGPVQAVATTARTATTTPTGEFWKRLPIQQVCDPAPTPAPRPLRYTNLHAATETSVARRTFG